MEQEATPAEIFVKRQKAERTLSWHSVDRISFLWDEKPVLGYYDRERRSLYIINSVDDQTRAEVYEWLDRLADILEETEDNE